LWYLLTLAVSLTAFAAFVFLVRARTLSQELDAGLQLQATRLAADLPPILGDRDVDGRLAMYASFSPAAFALRRDAGRIVFRSPSFPELDAASDALLTEPVRGRKPIRTIRSRSGTPLRVVVEQVIGPRQEPFAVQVVGSTAPNSDRLRELALIEALGVLTVLLAARWGSAFTARRALAPLEDIVQRLRDIHGTHPGARVHVTADTDDVDRLVVTLNQTLDRLEEPVYSARRFAADVSHELQTPLTAIRMALERCERGQQPPDEYPRLASELLVEVGRLSTLIRDLRLLAVAGAGALVTKVEPIELAALASECCEIAQAVAESKQIRLTQEIEPGITVSGSPLHLRRVLLNLTDNAVRYSPEQSTIDVRVGAYDGHAFISVRDCGCGIGPADLPHIFKPFYRADPARARESGGSGLGLAIAEQVVLAHGGRIEVTSTPDKGSTFVVYLPLA
jgi:signal transduction histidine kinase